MRPVKNNAPSLAWLLCLGVVLALFGVHAGKHWSYTVDDAGISFAYAKNVALGNGLVLTPGAERVEAATNLLWCLVLVPAHWVGDKHELLAKVLGLAGACATLACMALFPSQAYKRRPRFFDLVAPLALTTMPHFALWSVSGLENGFFSGLTMAALLALAREENHPNEFPWSSVLLVCVFATRPDGILYVGAFGAAKLLRSLNARMPKQDIVWGAALAFGIGGIELFRLAYFAWPWPNSFYTKKRTFNFGKDLLDFKNEGWSYVGRFLDTYKLDKALFAAPLVLIGARTASVARIAILISVAAGFFFPVYSHGDWMHEFRFMTFVTPFLLLAVAEGVRGVAQVAQFILPKSLRPAVALGLTLVLGHRVLKYTTANFPDRLEKVGHDTLDMKWVQGRARYFVAMSKMLGIDGRPLLLDPDVGGSSYDGRLEIADMFGLGDVPIARTHPDNPPGTRESIFWERRPTFVHLHGAWFSAMELTRLEELEMGYLRLPGALSTGEGDPDYNLVRRDVVASPWFTPAEVYNTDTARTDLALDGYTLSHRAVEPRRNIAVEITVANAQGMHAGAVEIVPEGRALGTPSNPVVHAQVGGGLIDASVLLPGERPRVRMVFGPQPAGRYTVWWRGGEGHDVQLGPLEVRAGVGDGESRALAWNLDQAVKQGKDNAAWSLVRMLALRVFADPNDSVARAALGKWGKAMVSRARVLAQSGAVRVASLLARSVRAVAADDRDVQSEIGALGEMLAERARDAERAQQWTASFVFARESVLTDPRRSWSRRRVETLRTRVLTAYDGGRDQAAYRMAASARAGRVPLDRAVVMLGVTERWVEAAMLADRVGGGLTDPRARVVVAKGYLAMGRTNDALGMVAGVPCASAHDAEVTLGLRALVGRDVRPGETGCDAQPAQPPAPFNANVGSFEQAHFEGWTQVGQAFGLRATHEPVKDRRGRAYMNQTFVNGWRGYHYANSYEGAGDAGTGLLRSAPFVIPRDAEGISFLIGGGNDVDLLGVRLMIDGKAVMRQAGANTEGMRRVFWDVRSWAGQTATIEVYDQNNGGWGHVMVDDFCLEPVVPESAKGPEPPPAPPAPPVAAPAEESEETESGDANTDGATDAPARGTAVKPPAGAAPTDGRAASH